MTINSLPQSPKYPFAIFAVGDGATVRGYSDRYAGTVIKVSPNGKRVWIQEDAATIDPNFKPEFVAGGFSAHCTNQSEQSYTYERDEAGTVREVSLRLWRGRYVWTAKGCNPDGRQAAVAGRSKFRDYNF